jgi:muramoyltetrapeptide carboxypeptidase
MPRIAICAPSAPFAREDAERVAALAAAEFPALDLHFHPQCFVEAGHFAGPDEARLAALLECANDPQVDAVWFARGGYGSNRIAEAALAGMGREARGKTFLGYSDAGYLLAALYRNGIGRPVHGPMPADTVTVERGKTFLGYSDAGYLLAALYRNGIGRPVHGPMPADVRRAGGEDAVRRSLAWLAGGCGGLEPSLDERPAVAFNLITLAMLCGTPLMPGLAGHVVMVEEVSEHLYAVDRLFFHVTAHLGGIAGLRLGRVSEVPGNDRPFGAGPLEIARYWCARHDIALLGEADIGHDAANKIVPFGLASD